MLTIHQESAVVNQVLDELGIEVGSQVLFNLLNKKCFNVLVFFIIIIMIILIPSSSPFTYVGSNSANGTTYSRKPKVIPFLYYH